MSTVVKVNFEPRSNMMHVQTRDFPLVNPGNLLTNPTSTTVLVDGEWMSLDATGQNMLRAAAIAGAGVEAAGHSWPLYAERGRTDVQAIQKASLLWLGQWEADTRIYRADVAVGAGAIIATVGQAVKVASIAIVSAARFFCGLVGWNTADPGFIVGYVTRLPANNGGKLRIRGGMMPW